jgi:hypothetical protein
LLFVVVAIVVSNVVAKEDELPSVAKELSWVGWLGPGEAVLTVNVEIREDEGEPELVVAVLGLEDDDAKLAIVVCIVEVVEESLTVDGIAVDEPMKFFIFYINIIHEI